MKNRERVIGEREEFETLARTHAAAVFRIARRIVGEDSVAEDVTQEVFVAVLKRPATYLGREDPGRSLCWLAAKKALEALRFARNRSRHESESGEKEFGDTEGAEMDGIGSGARMDLGIDSRASSTEARAESGETQRALAQSLARLRSDLRVAVVLRFQEGLTFAEIAELTAISEPSAHDRVRRGILQLKVWLERAGFAALAIAIESELRAMPAPSMPPTLIASMTTLKVGTGLSTVSLQALLGSTLAASILGAALFVTTRDRRIDSDSQSNTMATREPAMVATATISPRSPSPNAPAPREAAESIASAARDPIATATVSGRVSLLPSDALLLPDCEVTATSLDHADKSMMILARASVRDDGTYELVVPATTTERYELHLDYMKCFLATGPQVKVGPGDLKTGQDLGSNDDLGERAEPFGVDLRLEDAAHRPLADLPVALERAFGRHGALGDRNFDGRIDARTDANGVVHLEGDRCGRKRLSIAEKGHSVIGAPRVDLEIVGDRPSAMTLVFPDVDARTIASLLPKQDPVTTKTMRSIRGQVVDGILLEPCVEPRHEIEAFELPRDSREDLDGDVIPNFWLTRRARQILLSPNAKATDRFDESVLAPGRYLLIAHRAGRAPAISAPLEVLERDDVANVTLRYEAGATIEGVVAGAAGEPIEGAAVLVTGIGPYSDARIRALDQLEGGASGHAESNASTDASGRFALKDLPANRPFRIVAIHRAFEPATSGTISLSPNDVRREFTLTLARSRPR